MNTTLKINLKLTSDPGKLLACGVMLLHLSVHTFNASSEVERARSAGLTEHTLRALEAKIRVLVTYEARGVDHHSERGTIPFHRYFDLTPAVLLKNGIYGQIATALKPGAWRTTSLYKVELERTMTATLSAISATLSAIFNCTSPPPPR